MRIFKIIISFQLCFSANIFALEQVDLATYYDRVNSYSSDSLRYSLNQILREQIRLSYGQAWSILSQAHRDQNNSDNIILFYSQKSIPASYRASGFFNNEKNYWNREHLWPRSRGVKNNSAETDLHNLVPVDKTINNSRGNKDFDDGGTPHHECKLCFTDGDSWEPPDVVKGDIARILFYMDTRYEGGDSSGASDLFLINQTNNNKLPAVGVISTLAQWHCDDPVSKEEKVRNDIIFEWQENRNPFVDQPFWANIMFQFNCKD